MRRAAALVALLAGLSLVTACDRVGSAAPSDPGVTPAVSAGGPAGGDTATLDGIDRTLDQIQREVDGDSAA